MFSSSLQARSRGSGLRGSARLVILLVATIAAPAVTADTADTADTVTLDINMFRYQPEVIEVPVGATVVWTNRDDIDHTVTTAPGSDPALRFDSGRFGQGETFARTFAEPGEYRYICSLHPSMTGTIRVVRQDPGS